MHHAVKHHPGRDGKVHIRFKVDSHGRPTSVKVKSKKLVHPALHRCLLQFLSPLRFDKPAPDASSEVVVPMSIFW